MNKLNFLSKLAIGSLVGMIGGISFQPLAKAMVTTTNCEATNMFCTLAELDGGGTITVGDKLFNNWDEVLNPQTVNLEDIQVSGIFPNTNAPGIQFMAMNDALTVQGGTINLVFDFQVTVLDSKQKIVDNELNLTSFLIADTGTPDTAKITIQEDVGTATGLNNLGDKEVFSQINPNIEALGDREVFSPQQSVFVRKMIEIEAPGNSVASLNKFEQRFSQTPEPGTILGLLAISGLGLGLKRKKQS